MMKEKFSSNTFKRIKNILALTKPEYSYRDIKIILENFGFRETTSQGGSHRVFVLENRRKGVIYGAEQITVPNIKGRKVKRFYVKRIIKILHLQEWYDEYEKSKRREER